jgi:D-cysteine desulfhydrase
MKVTIRKFEQRDIADKIRWINDERNNKFLHYDLPLEYDRTLEWFERVRDRSDRFDGVIEVDGRPVGIIGLLNIDPRSGKGEYYIALGEHEYKGKGVAIKASRLLLEYAFGELNLNKVYLFTEVDNVSAQRLFERLGFRKEGLLREDVKRGSRYVHRYVYGLTKNDFVVVEQREPKSEGRFLHQQTPIQPSNLDLHGNALFYKRDDLLPFSFGGNKARKALHFFEELAKLGNDCVVTYGSGKSNHCRVVANMAASRRLPCYIISPCETDGKSTKNNLMMRVLGAKVISCPLDEVSKTIDKTLEVLREQGLNPYFIEGGGHGNLGTEAYVECYEEIEQQQASLGLRFDYIFLPSGTGTTQAGLVCGKLIHGGDTQIVGISIARRNPRGRQVILDSVCDYLESRHLSLDAARAVGFADDYVLDGYGSYSRGILDTIHSVLLKDGIALDTTYTGKAFWGMQQYLKKHGVTGKNVLFIHTGGTPLFFDDLEELVSART